MDLQLTSNYGKNQSRPYPIKLFYTYGWLIGGRLPAVDVDSKCESAGILSCLALTLFIHSRLTPVLLFAPPPFSLPDFA